MGGWRCGYLRRSREGSDYTTINLYFVSHVFQSTLPRRERRPANGRFRCAPPHFNPRSREGSDSTLCGGNLFLICISIHAPAKGATDYFFIQLAQSKISIHAPAKGATACSAAACGADCHFNPRSREGSDSTTASRRSRDSHFNPRSREGSDPAPPRCRHLHHSISIHAPAKGATPAGGETDFGVGISIHAPAKGATDIAYAVGQSIVISIHAPAKGATSTAHRTADPRKHFNPRSREGSD